MKKTDKNANLIHKLSLCLMQKLHIQPQNKAIAKKGTSQAGIYPNKSSCPSRNVTDMTNHVGNCFTNQPKLQHD